ncbi:glycosyltransferase [Burkholderia ambifaria]|jgi:glycosyltransferase involved in cell wall biosynthesis|uniref:glycosyltransferase n=1 Tax=Burkholderia ambifaria TaxID=152480 RepID=UPI001B9E9918|nr:glycosyltransferase [Burkholderia ambifaria]MBR8221568.1 glycosyltransferase [Burkholderia ambifaria]
MKVFILHPGKANYPEIAAYGRRLRTHGFEVFDGDLDAYARFPDRDVCILWCIMGFYRALPPARFVIHDYRSLSVGRLAAVKDRVKRVLNVRPDLRIFQNERMRDAMAFRDGVRALLLPMGVPDWIFEAADANADGAARGGVHAGANAGAAQTPSGRFCYIGEMSRERGFHKVLAAYRDARRDETDTLVLVGNPEPEIRAAFADTPGIRFVGRVPQPEALRIVRDSEYAVCFFPYHRPHCFQTPTKLLEYASLGKKIVCNDAPSNVRTAHELGIQCHVTGAAIFDELFPLSRIRATHPDPAAMKSLEWGRVIERSGVLAYIDAVAGRGPGI